MDDRLQLACCDASQHAPQDPSHPLRIGLLEHVQLEDVIPDVGAHGGHFVRAQNVTACHLDEPATVPQAGQAGVDEPFPRQAVEHYVHTCAVARLHGLGGKRRCAAVEDVLHAQRPEIGLFRRAGSGKDLRSRRLHELDGREAHPARTGVDQHALAGLESRQLEGQRGGHERARHRRQPRHRDAGGCVRHQFLVCDHLGPEGTESQPDHLVANGDVGDLGPDVEDAAAHLPSQEPFLDEAERPEDVPEVEPGGRNGYPNFPGLQSTRRQRLDIRAVEDPGRIRGQNPLPVIGQRQPLRLVAGTQQAGDLTASRAESDRVLTVRIHQLVREVGWGCTRGGIQIDHFGLQMRSFTGDCLAKAPQRSPAELPATFTLQQLRPVCYEPDALLGCRVCVAHALHHCQRARAHPHHVFADLFSRGRCTMSVQRQEVREAAERRVARKSFDRRPPRLAPRHVHAHAEHARTGRVRHRVVLSFFACQQDGLISCRQLRRQFGRKTTPVRGKNPYARWLPHRRRTLGDDHALVGDPRRVRLVHTQDVRRLETRIGERLPPHGGGRQGVMRAVVVGEPPPTVQLAKSQVHPAQATEVLERDHLP